MPAPTRSLFAVLAGINTYPSPVKSLEGALNDLQEWKKYLDKQSDHFNINTTVLTNDAVTKNDLTTALVEALKNATESDVVFFFFAGHGTREKTDSLFAFIEQDEALECLVCHDSIRKDENGMTFNLLADKELHYLLSEYAKEGTHILFVFDCCHSGGITRNTLIGERYGACIERRLTLRDSPGFIAPQRSWEQYLFADKWTKKSLETNGWLQTVIQKPHITLSACQNDESAFEQNGKGIFTTQLIDVLTRTNGAISYYHLQSRVRMFTQNQFRQTPESYIPRGHEHLLFRNFLDKVAQPSGVCCTMAFSKFKGWIIDLGAIHGITLESGPVKAQIGSTHYEFQIEEVFTNYSKLAIAEETSMELNKDLAYDATVKEHFEKRTCFYVDKSNSDNDNILSLTSALNSFLQSEKPSFIITDDPAEAAYYIREHDEKLWICNNDNALRPVTAVSINAAGAIERVIDYMGRISKWESIRSLENPSFVTKEFPFFFRVFKILPDKTRKELILNCQTLNIGYERTASGEWSGKLQACIINTSTIKYYYAILYMSTLFEVYGNMLDGKVVGLAPGETTWIFNGETIELDLEPHIVEYNYPSSDFYLKVFASTKPFTVDIFEQAPLPSPSTIAEEGIGAKKGFRRKEKHNEDVSWFTFTVGVRAKNPMYREDA